MSLALRESTAIIGHQMTLTFLSQAVTCHLINDSLALTMQITWKPLQLYLSAAAPVPRIAQGLKKSLKCQGHATRWEGGEGEAEKWSRESRSLREMEVRKRHLARRVPITL